MAAIRFFGSNHIKLLIVIALTLVSLSCDKQKHEADSEFDNLFNELKNKTNENYDELYKVYLTIDSLSNTRKSPELNFLKLYAHGVLLARNGENTRAIIFFKKAENAIEKSKNFDTLIAKTRNAIGVNYMSISKFDSSIYYFNSAKKLLINPKPNHDIEKIDINIAQLHYDMGDIDKTMDIVDAILTKPLSTRHLHKAMHLKANILGSQGKFVEAIKIDHDALENSAISEEFKPMFYNNLALCHLGLKQVDSAITFINKAIEIDTKLKSVINLGADYVSLADIYVSLNMIDSANHYFEIAMNTFRKNNNLNHLLSLYKYKKSFSQTRNNHQETIILQDSIQSIESRINIINLKRSVELLNIEFESERKSNEIVEKSLRLRNQQFIIIILSLSALISIIVFLGFYGSLKRKNRQRQAEQNLKLLEVSAESELRERERIAKDLHDNIGQKLAVVQMQVSSVEEIKELESTSLLIKDLAKDIRNISHNLYPAKLEIGLVEALKALTEQLNFSGGINAKIDTQNYSEIIKLDKSLRLILYRIVQEFIHNSLKHSSAQNILISLKIEDEVLVLELTDDGVGIDIDKLKTSNGLGFNNIQKQIKEISGEFQVISSVGNGMKQIIKIRI